MKKRISVLLALVLCVGMLAACGAKENTESHVYQDLTICIPAEYIDLTEEKFAEDLDFVFGLDPIAVNGIRETKQTFTDYGLDLDLEDYGKLLRLSNNVSSEPEWKDGILTFSYDANGYTYVVALFETEEAFWSVQSYCPTENYGKSAPKMWEILSSVTV